MTTDWQRRLERWVELGLLDSQQADRIRQFERADGATGTSAFTHIIWSLGAVLLAAGVLLFVSAHWDEMSPAVRFASVLAMLLVLHGGAALFANRAPALSYILHAAGTAALGAGIFLAGQIFNLAEHWPAGILLWSLGAVAGWFLLRHWSQLLWVALLVPAWLVAEWWDYVAHATPVIWHADDAAYFLLLLALAYLCLAGGDVRDSNRRALAWLGGIGLLPAAGYLFVVHEESGRFSTFGGNGTAITAGAFVASLVLPLIPVWLAKRRVPLANLIAMAWAVVLLVIELVTQRARDGYGWRDDLATYAWYAAGGIGLVLWGMNERHRTRINLGVAIFAFTLCAFYFSDVYDKLGRALGLIAAGVLFIVGGWFLERTRRRLVARVAGPQS
jgi:uncharacterized membrane protein